MPLPNAQRMKINEPIAMSRIEHGEIVDGKNVVKTFEFGDVVALPKKAIDELIACGAVKQLGPESPAEAG
jgi:hypothetical protein